MQMAAVMALRFNAKQPKGASKKVATPVMLIILDNGMSYPAARMAATPGKFCDAMVTINKGKAKLTVALRLKLGAVNTGTASENCSNATLNWPRSTT